MPIRYHTIKQRERSEAGKVHAPLYLTYNVFDFFQTVTDDIIISHAPLPLKVFGNGQYRVIADGGSTPNTAEVFITLDPIELYDSEKTTNVTTEAASKIKWIKVGDTTTNGNGMFSLDPPFTLIKVKFTGTAGTGAKVTLGAN